MAAKNNLFVFPIKKGMPDNELLSVLKNNVAGETRQQLETVLADARDDVGYTSLINEIQTSEHEQMTATTNQRSHAKQLSEWLRGQPAFKVLDADSTKNIALVSKMMVRNDMFGDVNIAHDYYLVGVSDEFHLFMHPLNGCNPNRASGHGLSGLFGWMNREDWGFKHTDRMQGDILARVEKVESPVKGDNLKTKGQVAIGPHIAYLGDSKTIFNGQTVEPAYEDGLEVSDDGGFEIETNHKLKTDGKLFELRMTDNKLTQAFMNLRPQSLYIVTGASAVVLEHPEHQTKSLHVPKNHVVVIARQRGENFSTPRALD